MGRLEDSIAELSTNTEQWEAFSAEGNCVVQAPPGSGKTKLLAARIAYDLKHRITAPRGAACITLTNAAAEELTERVLSLGVGWSSTLFLGTVHSFALNRILLPFKSATGVLPIGGIKIATKQQISDAMRTAMAVWPAGLDDRLVGATVRRMRRLMPTQEEWTGVGPNIRAVADAFDRALRGMGVIDFDGVIAESVGLVETFPSIRRSLVARYHGLYVDEYQDLAPGLHRLVEALCFGEERRSSLFAVGDPDQAIFGWTGTRPELLKELSERTGVTPVDLRTNYRSGSQIIDIAGLAIGSGRQVVGTRPGGEVQAHRCPRGFLEQSDWAVRRVRTLEDQAVPLEEIAIVVPANDDVATVAASLTTAGVPFYVRKTEYPETRTTRLVAAAAAWVASPADSGISLGEILRSWRALLGTRVARSQDVALVRTLRELRQDSKARVVALIDGFLLAGLGEALADASKAEERNAVSEMRSYFSSATAHAGEIVTLGQRLKPLGRVEVLTIPSCKGLEFDYVIALGLDQEKFPFFASLRDPEKLAEERRKFYVVLTRARSHVDLLYSGFVMWKRSFRPNYAGPSMFLREIGLA
ncbi:ATP-dependent helicase [Micromonospora sp. NPDC005324]|uniref:ATP-dependent helicase n=1 Tax=Micromonospora sp. NPDC005324 TaxID=3157033 RepID=UPI0033BE304B